MIDIMMTKLKFLVVKNTIRRESSFRKFFAVCLLAMVTQVGLASDWTADHDSVTYDFTKYTTEFSLIEGASTDKKIGGWTLYTMEDNGVHALDAIFAAQLVTQWQIKNDGGNTAYYLYQGGSGDRYLSISNLFANVTIKINYTPATDGSKPIEQRSIRALDDSYISNSLTNHVLESNTAYILTKTGPLDLVVPRYVKIQSIIIDYTSHPLLFKRNDANIAYYKDNIPYYRCQLSSRNFTEPKLFDTQISPTYSISTIDTPNGYDPAVFRVDKTEANPPQITATYYDIMMNNLGVSQITATHNSITDSYRLEIWDNIASHSVTEIVSGDKVVGHRFQFTGPGVVHNRTITDVPGIEVKFSVTSNGTEPNTTVAREESGHYVAFTNDDWGWWDRYPHNTWQTPTGGSFYTFTATAKGKLKFGGAKMGASGSVYLVKLDANHYQAALFEGKHDDGNGQQVDGPTGYLDYSTFPTINNSDFIISNTDGIEMAPGVVYDLQGETTPLDPEHSNTTNRWAPFLLEWFSYELDNTLNINKTYAVASQTGYQMTNSGATNTGSYIATDIVIEGSPQIGRYGVDNNNQPVWENNNADVKGNITAAKVRKNGNNLEFYDIVFSDTNEDKMGGAIKVRLQTAVDNYIDFTLTIPYGKHVWDFRSKADQTGATRPGAWSFTNTQLWNKMYANSASANWQIAWKVKNGDQYVDPIIVANSTINGDNAFCMDNTAGLVFSTGARSFGARGMRPDNFYKSGWTVTENDSTNLLWMKGNATIYFPGVTAGQYIKIYTYRHSDDKGETFQAKNLVDLDGTAYDGSTKFIMHGMWEERHPGYVGDNMKGCAIFRVPSDYTAQTDFNNIPQLTLCDDGWVKIYRIEIMDEFEPDLILTEDVPDNNFCPVDYDGKFGSVVVKKRGNYTYSEDKMYTATVGQTQCQHANTCDYEVIANTDVVDVNREVWRSSGGVDYNRLNLKYKKAGLVRIVQREKAKILGSTNIWTETRDENENMVYKSSGDAAVSASTLPAGYVIDKNEYFINVGELTVQNYPYTWDFTQHNMYQGSSATKTNLGASGSNWTVSGNTCSQSAKTTQAFGVDQTAQNLTLNKASFPQGAQLMNSAGLAVAETEGLGLFRPKTTKTFYYYSTVDDTFDKRERKYEGYDLVNNAIKINGETLEGVDSIIIPEVPSGMYIFVNVASGSPKFGQIKAGGTTIPPIYGTEGDYRDIFSLNGNVYCYYQNTGSKQDVTIPLNADTRIKEIAITNITKGLDRLGYATESRACAIDHTYEGTFTENDVNPYIITTAGGAVYDYKGYPMVKKIPINRVNTDNNATADDIVPANVGVLLYNENKKAACTSPLFVPAVNNIPAQDAVDNDFWKSNWLIPNVQSQEHNSEVTSRNAATSAKPSINSLPYYSEGNEETPMWNMNNGNSTLFGHWSSDPIRYVDLAGFKELRIYQTDEDAIRCFFIDKDGSSLTINSNSTPALETGSGYKYVNLKSIYLKCGQVKLISIKASAHDASATATDIKVIPYANPDETGCTKFIMSPNYYVYYKNTGSTSGEVQTDVESFYRMRLYQGTAEQNAEYNTLAANKAILLIGSLPTALWNGGNGLARQGVIYMDLQDIEEAEANGIDAPMIDATSGGASQKVYYTLSGSRINGKPTKKGVYICNGEKVCVK